MVSLIDDLLVWHASYKPVSRRCETSYKDTEGHSFVTAKVSAFSLAHLASVTKLA